MTVPLLHPLVWYGTSQTQASGLPISHIYSIKTYVYKQFKGFSLPFELIQKHILFSS
jgi:hypothetical protein